jgi:hypothetical protein
MPSEKKPNKIAADETGASGNKDILHTDLVELERKHEVRLSNKSYHLLLLPMFAWTTGDSGLHHMQVIAATHFSRVSS